MALLNRKGREESICGAERYKHNNMGHAYVLACSHQPPDLRSMTSLSILSQQCFLPLSDLEISFFCSFQRNTFSYHFNLNFMGKLIQLFLVFEHLQQFTLNSLRKWQKIETLETAIIQVKIFLTRRGWGIQSSFGNQMHCLDSLHLRFSGNNLELSTY